MALFLEACHGFFDFALVVQVGFGEVDIEVHAEVGEGVFDVFHLQGVAAFTQNWQGFGFAEVLDARVVSEDLLGHVGNVLARVAALLDFEAMHAPVDRGREHVHLGAGVVDVVLGGDVGAGCAQHAHDRIAERRPAGVADVERTGWVR